MWCYVYTLLILFSTFLIYDFSMIGNGHPGVYLPASKLVLTERHAEYVKCVALCDSGAYHHHHLKQTHIGKCH